MREYDSMEEQRSEMGCIIIISFINNMSETITILTFYEIRRGEMSAVRPLPAMMSTMERRPRKPLRALVDEFQR